jgi:hypothetical protein
MSAWQRFYLAGNVTIGMIEISRRVLRTRSSSEAFSRVEEADREPP